jgi:hypothetical protein
MELELEDIKKQADKVKELLSVFKAKETERGLAYTELKSEAIKLKEMYETIETEDYLRVSADTGIKLKPASYCKFAKDAETKKQVIKWLEERGYADEYVTVNAQSFNSLIKKEMEANPEMELPSFVELSEWTDLKIGNFNLIKND